MKNNSVLTKMMLLFAALLFFRVSFAPAFSEEPQLASVNQRFQKSSVWEIGKGEKSFFLGGSIHILREQDLPLPIAFDAAFDKSGILVLEADTGKMSEPEVAAYLQQQLLLPEGITLRSILDKDVYEALEMEFQALGVPSIDAFSLFKPSMVMNVLTFLYIQKFGFMEQGVDDYYLAKAKDAGKATAFLESVESQIDMLVGMGDGYENDYVKYSLEDLEETEAYLNETVAEWREGGAAVTETILSEMKRDWPVIYKALILDRNNAWIPILENFLNTEPVEFVVVGLAHLHGPDGLLRHFQNNGYAIRPVVK
jgi:uncharacterized protein YbaP (TraB family)